MQDLSARYTKIFDGEEIFILARIKQGLQEIIYYDKHLKKFNARFICALHKNI